MAGTGLVAGMLGGLFGIGGGIVVVPVLYAAFGVAGVPDEVRMKLAVGTSLATIVVTSLRSVQAHGLAGQVNRDILRQWGPFIGAGSVFGALVARVVQPGGLVLFFGVGLCLIGLHRLLTRTAQSAAGSLPGVGTQRGLAAGTGLISSLMGIGGGVLGVLLLTRAGEPVHRATGTAAGFGVAVAIPGALAYLIFGFGQVEMLGTLGYVSFPAFSAVAVGTIYAAPVGARLAGRLKPGMLTRLFGAYLVMMGVAMTWEGTAALR